MMILGVEASQQRYVSLELAPPLAACASTTATLTLRLLPVTPLQMTLGGTARFNTVTTFFKHISIRPSPLFFQTPTQPLVLSRHLLGVFFSVRDVFM
ncbi:unnamed protein product [Arctogadus glacialis]